MSGRCCARTARTSARAASRSSAVRLANGRNSNSAARTASRPFAPRTSARSRSAFSSTSRGRVRICASTSARTSGSASSMPCANAFVGRNWSGNRLSAEYVARRTSGSGSASTGSRAAASGGSSRAGFPRARATSRNRFSPRTALWRAGASALFSPRTSASNGSTPKSASASSARSQSAVPAIRAATARAPNGGPFPFTAATRGFGPRASSAAQFASSASSSPGAPGSITSSARTAATRTGLSRCVSCWCSTGTAAFAFGPMRSSTPRMGIR
jgi:hypothetical protein